MLLGHALPGRRVERPPEHLRGLGAIERVAAVEDVEGYAGNAEPLRLPLALQHVGHAFLARQVLADLPRVEPHAGCQVHEPLAVVQIQPFDEIGAKQRVRGFSLVATGIRRR